MIDNTEVRAKQLARLESVKTSRDSVAAEQALKNIEEGARSGEGNLLGLAVEAARARCSVGEISTAMEKVFGRHIASDRYYF